MGFSRTTAVYTGGARTFSLNFALGFIERSQVRVYVQGEVDGGGVQLYRQFTWIDDNTIRVTNSIANGATVVMERTVNKSSLYVDFNNPGFALRPGLDKALKHSLMAVHEVLDGRTDYVAQSLEGIVTASMGAYVQDTIEDHLNTAGIAYRNDPKGGDYNVYIPDHYPNLQAAVDANYFRAQLQRVNIYLRADTPILTGLLCANGDYSGFAIFSTGGTPFLGEGFVGIPDSAVPNFGTTGNNKPNNFIVGINASMPFLGCTINAMGRCDSGYYAFWNCSGSIRMNSGIINAGYNGLEARGSIISAYATNFSGAGGSAYRFAHGSIANIQSANGSNSCTVALGAEEDSRGALDVSRCSIVHARLVNLSNSGASGVNIRRDSIVCIQESNLSGAALIGADIKHASSVSMYSSNVSNCGTRAIAVEDVSSVDARGCSVGTSVAGAGANWVQVNNGGRLVITGSTGVGGLPLTTANTNIRRFNVMYGQGQIIDSNVLSWHPGSFSSTGADNGQDYSALGISQHSRNTTSAATHIQFFNPNGSVGQIRTSGTGTIYETTSDGRLKVNRTEIGYDPLLWLDAIEVFRADWVSPLTGELTGDSDILIEAQAIQPYAPEAVSIGDSRTAPGEEGFEPWGVDYSKIASPRALAAMKALRAENEALKAEIAAIKAHLNL